MINIGQTITLRTGKNVEHIYFIIGKYQDRYLLVNATTYKTNKPTDCILNTKDHPFIKHKSIINYGDARDATEATIENNIKNGLSRKLIPVSKTVLDKIKKGALRSDALLIKHRCYIPAAVSQPAVEK